MLQETRPVSSPLIGMVREGSKNVDGILKCLLSHIIIADIKDQSPLLVVSAGLFY